MKKILAHKLILIIAGALIIGFGGTVLYLSATSKKQNQNSGSSSTTTTQSVPPVTEKGEMPSSSVTSTTKAALNQTAPSGSTSLITLNTSVTAQSSPSDGSISLIFYPEGGGSYTIQQLISGSWQVEKENVNYSGVGGLQDGSLASGENSKTLRLLKIENGNYVAVSKEFTITRQDVTAAGGIKTYN